MADGKIIHYVFPDFLFNAQNTYSLLCFIGLEDFGTESGVIKSIRKL